MVKTLLSRDDGMLHLPGSSLCTFETLCGACDTTDQYTESTELPNCPGCIETARLVFQSITKSELDMTKKAQPVYRQRSSYFVNK